MRKYLVASIVAALVAATFATLPRLDTTEPDVFFYLKNLTPLYYVSVFVVAIVAIKYRRSLLGLFSAALLSLLVLWTPDVMMVQPWFPDSYAFTAEAVYVVRNGHLGNFHYLSTNPVVGLVFGPFMAVTGITPTTLQKVYTAFLAVILVVFIYLIAKAAKIKREGWVIAPLLFISIAWPNQFSLSRQSFSLVYYVACWFLLLYLIFRKADWRVFALLVLQIILVVMAHPATPVFLMANLLLVLVLALLGHVRARALSHNLQAKQLGIIVAALAVLSFSWFLWNLFVSPMGIASIDSMGKTLMSSLEENPSEVSGLAKLSAGGSTQLLPYTPIYGFLIKIKLVVTAVIFCSAIFFLLVAYKRHMEHRSWIILTGWTLSSMSSAVLVLYNGLAYFDRPALFSFFPWAILGASVFGMLNEKKGRLMQARERAKKAAKYVFLVVFIILPLFLMPVLKYGSLPILYPSSQELAEKSFYALYQNQTYQAVYFEFDGAYEISYIRYGILEPVGLGVDQIYVYGEGLNTTVAANSVLWISSRITMRDAFWIYKPSYHDIVENLSGCDITYNKVYDGGWSQWILVPTFTNKK
jgi:hypothetical protein